MEFRRYAAGMAIANYMPLPRCLLGLQLPTTALVIYAMLLDRATLSQKHDYTDFGGWIYVVYPIHELRHLLHLGDTAIKTNLRLLEQAGLIRRMRRSRTEASRIFILLPEDALMVGKPPDEGRKSVGCRGGKAAPSNIKKQQDIINLYQHEEGESL